MYTTRPKGTDMRECLFKNVSAKRLPFGTQPRKVCIFKRFISKLSYAFKNRGEQRTMIYVISDLHGYPLEKFQALLQKAKFSESDFLYILGDVVDRNGDGGVEMLGWLTEQPNIQLLLGNHEAMLLACSFVFEEITEQSVKALTAEKFQVLNTYMQNGGAVTLQALRALRKTAPGKISEILEFLREAPLYEAVTVGKRDFLLVHAGLGDFEPHKKISQYDMHDLLWSRPSLQDEYFDDILTIFGHTPTMYYGEMYTGKILKTRTWINIDVGVGSGQPPVLLRLDDLREFYAEA